VIIAGLGIMPVRNRYKIFIIDEVHQLSSASFNSLLKSIEEPPPHVVFMMATTELDKIPETVLSRSQVYEFRTISTKAIATQLRHIMDAEAITVGEESLQLIARDADGSMRDAQSKLDQVVAFTGKTITADDVATVLGLVGRDLLLDTVQAVVDEDAPAAFALAARAVEMGYDLRAVCRELSRLVRDLLVLSVDPTRVSDPEIAGESERDRLTELAGRFSREDLLRAFDLLTRAESDIRTAAQPRYQLEMALLRWIHLRKLMPIEDVIAGLGSAPSGPRTPPPDVRAAAGPGKPVVRPAAPPRAEQAPPLRAVAPPSSLAARAEQIANRVASPQPVSASARPAAAEPARSGAAPVAAGNLKDALINEIRKAKGVFYNMVVAQAQRVEIAGDQVTFSFSPTQRALKDQFEQQRTWLETLAQSVAGRRITFVAATVEPGAAAGGSEAVEAEKKSADKKTALREQAMADAGVQAMLEVFPAEIRDIEEL
jgi:DNA polymerase-3 subunit gamma/tau